MKLCEKSIDECLGLRVWNYHKIQLGTITSIYKELDNSFKEDGFKVRYDTVRIDWDNGKVSHQFLNWLELEVYNVIPD